jgi:UDP-N-acetylmuramyl tripeptide synthase
MRRAALLIARAAGWLSRRTGRGGGTTVPGVVLLKLWPHAVGDLGGRLARGSVVVSATNGKTTTARLIRSLVDAQGWTTVANTAGSNLMRGVATALIEADGDDQLGLFEVDEAALPAVAEALRPRVVVLMNLLRDQLDRYGELEALAARWAAMVAELPADTTLVLNADDPTIAALGSGHQSVVYFGLEDSGQGRGALAHATDSSNCPRCDAPLHYDLVSIAHMGHWRCEACGLRRPTPDVGLRRVDLRGLEGVGVSMDTASGPVDADLALFGLHNAYNAAAAVATAWALGLPVEGAGAALGSTGAAFGRGERVNLSEREIVMLLAKNPAGANENVRTITSSPAPLHILVMLNDRTADGHDVSWIWDVDYEPLLDTASSITVSGDRAHDMALRFVYGGCDRDRVAVVPTVAEALDHVIAATRPGDSIVALPTYTAMLDLRAELVRRGAARAFWEDR